MTENGTPTHPAKSASSVLQTAISRVLNVVRQIVPGSPLTWDTVILAMSVALLPLFYLTLKNWTEAWLVILALVSGYGILRSRLPLRSFFPDRATTWLFAALAFPIVAVFLSILLRGDLRWALWEQNLALLNGPSRLFLAAIALLWMNYKKVRFLDALQVTCAICVVVTVFFATKQQEGYDHRYTTSLLDFCAFGQQIVLLGLLQFFLLVFHPPRSRSVLVLTVLSILLAAYMGVHSGSRGGWIAVPPLLLLAAALYRGKKTKLLAVLLVGLLAIGGLLAANKVFRERLFSIYSEIPAWFAGDPTAGGSGRFTLMAISWELIKDNPIKGYAHKNYLWHPVYRMDPQRYMRSGFTYEGTEYHRYTLCDVGEHNQYLHELLMNGIFGLFALILLLLVPLIVFATRLMGSQGDFYTAAAVGVGFVLAFVVFGLAQGPFSYKVIASFYGFVIAGLASYNPRAADR
jgi:O-antigen ligase